MEENKNTLALDDLELDFDFDNDTSDEEVTPTDIDEVETKQEEEQEEEVIEEPVEEEAEETEEPEEEPELRLIDDIIRRTGLEFDEEELRGIDDTEDGIAELAERIAAKRAEQQLSDYLEKHPMTRQLLEFEAMGGDPEQFKKVFFPEVDYSKFEIQEEDVDVQKRIISDSLRMKGFSNERITRNLELYEDNGMLLEEAKDALGELSQIQEGQKQQLLEQQEQNYQQMQQQAQEMWNTISETIQKSDALNNIPLPKKDKSKFIDFITPDAKTGYSKRDEIANNLTLEDQLTLDLILYHGLDSFSNIIDNRTKTSEVRSIKERLKRSKSQNKTTKTVKSPKQASVDDLEFRI